MSQLCRILKNLSFPNADINISRFSLKGDWAVTISVILYWSYCVCTDGLLLLCIRKLWSSLSHCWSLRGHQMTGLPPGGYHARHESQQCLLQSFSAPNQYILWLVLKLLVFFCFLFFIFSRNIARLCTNRKK